MAMRPGSRHPDVAPRVWPDPTVCQAQADMKRSPGGTDEPRHPSPARVPAMLKVHPAPDGFTVYDVDADEAVVKFETRAEADELIATLQIQDTHAELRHWSLDKVPPVY